MSLTPNTKTNLATLCIVCGGVISLVLYIERKFGQQEAQDATTVAIIAEIRKEVTELKAEQYTTSMAAEQALRIAIENPGLRVPDPRNPGQIIVVDRARTIN